MVNLDIVGAEVLHPEGMRREPLSVADGRITQERAGRSVDLTGFMVLPGIVDVHGDGHERHMAPRRGAMKQMDEGLVATEAELAANGVTTGVIAQFVSWEGGVRGEEYAEQVFCTIRDTAPSLVTDIRAQLRLEMHMLHLYEDVPDMMTRWGIDYIVFNDHLPHDKLSKGKQPAGHITQALRARRSPEAHYALMMELYERAGEVPDAVDKLCAVLRPRGVRIGSHDDATKQGRADWHARGAQVAEFPETIEAAEATRDAGDLIVLGSPNAVRGGSHKRNVSAVDLISMGLCDALASDYHYPSPRRAALMLAQSGVLPLPEAWALISSGPAAVLGLTDRGTLAPGQRADIVILDSQTKRVAATMVEGTFSYVTGGMAERLLG